MNVRIWQRKSLFVALGLTAAAGLVVWLPVPFAFRVAAATLLAFFLPGWWFLRAIAVIAGRQETLFEHTKGPVEVLLPAVFGLLGGRFEPCTLRFPFALAHTVAMDGNHLLAGRLFNRNVGLLAALILEIWPKSSLP